MDREIIINNKRIVYKFQCKKVKNINLRIKPDGTVNVSANNRIEQKVIEDFMRAKADFIFKALEKYERIEKQPLTKYFDESEIRGVILRLCETVYPYFEKLGIKYPEIRFRKMVSRWGSCHSLKGILTFNINLMYAPIECIEYVVLHEFTHFLQANHSYRFYEELEKVCPDWKIYANRLKEINIR